jgi:hypothetical protein
MWQASILRLALRNNRTSVCGPQKLKVSQSKLQRAVFRLWMRIQTPESRKMIVGLRKINYVISNDLPAKGRIVHHSFASTKSKLETGLSIVVHKFKILDLGTNDKCTADTNNGRQQFSIPLNVAHRPSEGDNKKQDSSSKPSAKCAVRVGRRGDNRSGGQEFRSSLVLLASLEQKGLVSHV